MKEIKLEIREEIKYAFSLINEQTQVKSESNQQIIESTPFKAGSIKERYKTALESQAQNQPDLLSGHKAILNPESEKGKHLTEVLTKDYSKILKLMVPEVER